jgi:hypothetical protein
MLSPVSSLGGSHSYVYNPREIDHHRHHSWQLTVQSFCGYRVLLNLQKLAKNSSPMHMQDSWVLTSLHNRTTSGTMTTSYELPSLNDSSSASQSKTTRPEADIAMVPRTASGTAYH